MLSQLAVFVENRPGRITDILKVIADHHLDIHGLSVADSADFGVFRMILSDPVLGKKVIQEAGFIVKMTDVLAIDVYDTPGGLHQALSLIADQGINVNYMYAFGTKLAGHAMIILKTDDDRRSATVLRQNGVDVLDADQVEERLNAE